jgi:hypothetical protein
MASMVVFTKNMIKSMLSGFSLVNLIIFVLTVFTGSVFTKKLIMKMSFQLSTGFLMLGLISLQAQDQTKIPGGIAIAFKAGNASELSKYINSTVQLLLLEKEDFYKKNVAETILKDFFDEYKTKEFVVIHQGGMNDAHYAIGNLKTEKGNFRVSLFLKKVDQVLLIHQIRIEPDEGK